MISVCCFIVCISVLYSFAQDETMKTWKTMNEEQELILNSLNVENQDEFLANLVTPYWNLTYDEQLVRKQKRCRTVVDMIVKRSRKLKNPMKYTFFQIIPSPVTKAYVNRDVYSIRRGVDGNPKTVGLIVGKLTLGRVVSVHPTKLITTKESHKIVAQAYEDFIRSSPLPPNLRIHDGGYWRSVLIRSNEAGDVMVAVTVQPLGFNVETIEEQKQELKNYFFKHLPNITLFQQECINQRCTQSQAPYILLYGKPYLLETLNGYKFKISPDTYFQINKLGAEVLYDTIIRTAKLKPNTTVLDLYSGTGVISLMVSKFVKEVVGIEYNPQQVTDATENIEFNNVCNIVCLLGGAERKLTSVMHRIDLSSDVVAIVSAGNVRPGLNVIKTIRKSPQISRLVYITSKPDKRNAIDNFVELCNQDMEDIPPFTMTEVIPIDLLPQTTEVNLVLLFQRLPLTNI